MTIHLYFGQDGSLRETLAMTTQIAYRNHFMVEKVGYTKPSVATRSTRRSGTVSGTEFADALSKAEGVHEATATEATSGIGGIASLGGLLSAQEVDEREARKRKEIKRGRLTLDALAGLRDALLLGELPISTIENLERIVAQERQANPDPVLAEILDEIELRAAVELAKLEMAGIIPPHAQ